MLPKHLAIAASRAIVQSLMQSNLMILLRIGTIRLLGLRLGPRERSEPECNGGGPFVVHHKPALLYMADRTLRPEEAK